MKKFLKDKKTILIVILLLIGVTYRLILTTDGNFIFHMDIARDMIDVREMVMLHKLRLIGPTSGIEGIYNGPAWYYMLATVFVISSGHPYASIILMIIFWAIGGYFILKITSRYGLIPMLASGAIWISSNYVVLANLYAFNPNPVVLLTPFLIFLLEQYFNKKTLMLSLAVWFLGGLFFNFEMAFGIFLPAIIILAVLIINKQLLKNKYFWLGSSAFILTLIPQILFYFKNWQLLSTSLVKFINTNNSYHSKNIGKLYFDVLTATMMNWKLLSTITILGIIFLIFQTFRDKLFRQDKILAVSLCFFIVPFLGSIILPLNFMPWHLGGAMAAAILILGIFLHSLGKVGNISKILSVGIGLVVMIYAAQNLDLKATLTHASMNHNPTLFANEIKAVDYVYQQAQGKNFRVYIYLPSVYDYPYQYLFWWYGQNKYGYLPIDYAYLPNQPAYIAGKEKFISKSNPPDSGLIFLIKQPDQNGERHLWENNFKHLEAMSTTKVGPLEIEILKEGGIW